MVTLIIGGSASGKSAYGETVACRLSDHPVYLATMDSHGDSAKARIKKHRAMRSGKGFDTVECKFATAMQQEALQGRTVLLEDLPNLVANELFSSMTEQPEAVKQRVLEAFTWLQKETEHLVIITGDLASEGLLYDESTTAYLRVLGELQQEMARKADNVFEVVAGIPSALKGESK
jgi:adenosylcobinamide kinase/adenosylcobinamide-phosphate guanylyltransferase